MIPPGVDTGTIVPLKAAERRAARAAARAARPRTPRRQRQPAGAAQGHGRADRGRRPPGVFLSGPGGGHRGRGTGAGAPPRASPTQSPATVRMLGAVSDEDRAALLGGADVFVMACRSRWLGLEQEGFGIVFLEAAAAGVPQIAGDSGGASEAVLDGVTGLVVGQPGRSGSGGRGPAQPAGRPDPAAEDGPGRPVAGCRNPSTTTFSLLGWPRRWPEWQADPRRERGHEQEGTHPSWPIKPQSTCRWRHRPSGASPSWPTSSGTPNGRPTSRRSRSRSATTRAGPQLVTLRAAAFGRSTSITLAYDYSEAPRALSWKLTQGDITTKLDGSYVFEPDETVAPTSRTTSRRNCACPSRASSRCGPPAASWRRPCES